MLATSVSLLYLIAAGLWLVSIGRTQHHNLRRVAYGLGVIAWLSHAWLLYQWIDLAHVTEAVDVQRTQNLHVNNVFSLIMWTAILFIQLLAIKRSRLLNMAVMLFPLAAGSILLVQFAPGYYLLSTGENAGQLVHILIAVATFSVLSVATLQAILVGIQDRLLRRKQVSGWQRILPPLETMETILYAFVVMGFVGLSIILIGSITMAIMGVTATTHSHSPYLAVIAWLAFLVILVGRRYAGWHGRTMMLWTIFGVLILSASYFGMWIMTGLTK